MRGIGQWASGPESWGPNWDLPHKKKKKKKTRLNGFLTLGKEMGQCAEGSQSLGCSLATVSLYLKKILENSEKILKYFSENLRNNHIMNLWKLKSIPSHTESTMFVLDQFGHVKVCLTFSNKMRFLFGNAWEILKFQNFRPSRSASKLFILSF